MAEFSLVITLSIKKKKMGQLLEGDMGLRDICILLRRKKLEYIYMLIGIIQEGEMLDVRGR